MKEETACGLKALLSSFYPSDYKEFYRFLDPSLVTLLQKKPNKETIDFPHLLSKTRWMEKIHYSWFYPILEPMPKETQAQFLSLFPKEEKKELKTLLKLDEEREAPLFLRPFLYMQLFEKMHTEALLPREFLPVSELDSLFKLSRKELLFLVDLLGIYDLAYEMRQVVDKQLITKIHNALSKEELSFLNHALKQPVKWVPPKLNIASWDGDTKRLKTLLHYRGLSRLSSAASEENMSFKQHLCFQFDIGRGKVLMKLFAGKSDPAMIPYFRGQLLDLLKRFRSS